jgi:hypothetical protein
MVGKTQLMMTMLCCFWIVTNALRKKNYMFAVLILLSCYMVGKTQLMMTMLCCFWIVTNALRKKLYVCSRWYMLFMQMKVPF